MTVPSKVFTSYLQAPDAIEQMELAKALIESASVVVTITNEEEAAKVSEYRHQCNQAAGKLDTMRLIVTTGARQVVQAINDEFNPQIEALKSESNKAGIKVSDYLMEKQARASEEATVKSMEDIDRAKEGVLTAREEVNTLTKRPEKQGQITGVMGSKTSLRGRWTWKITDIAKVPEEYLVEPDQRVLKAKLNSEASGRKENANVQGIKFYKTTTVTSRS